MSLDKCRINNSDNNVEEEIKNNNLESTHSEKNDDSNGDDENTPKKKGKKKVLGVIVNVGLVIVFVFLVLVLILALISKITGENGKPSFLGIGIYTIESGSMEPEISTGDVIIAKNVNPSELKEGDIITFWSDKEKFLITHRIVDISGNMITTKGDANNVSDEPIHISKVYAKYQFKISGLGYFIGFLRSPVGFFLVIFIPILLFLAVQVVSIAKKVKAYKEEEKLESKEIDEKTKRLEEEIQELKERNKMIANNCNSTGNENTDEVNEGLSIKSETINSSEKKLDEIDENISLRSNDNIDDSNDAE